MLSRKKTIIILALIGSLILILGLFISRKFFLGIVVAVLLYVALFFCGKLGSSRYFEREIVSLLRKNSGKIEKDKLIDYFKNKADTIREKDVEDMVLAAVLNLQKKGSVTVDETGIVILVTGRG